jgi:serine/threonine protein kinase
MAGRRNYSEDLDDDEGPSTLSAILDEPHFPLGHVLLTARDAVQPLGINDPPGQRLGEGSFGTAYEVPLLRGKRSVLKFTRDPTEAQASAFLVGKSSKHVVDIYETWSLNWTHEKKLRGWYAIHRAYLNPLSKKDKELMHILWVLYEDMSLDLKFPRAMHRAMRDKWKSYAREELEEQQMHTQPNLSRVMHLLGEVSQCVHALHDLGIDWEDIHADNMMRRDDGTMAIGDVGYGLMHEDTTVHVVNLTPEVATAYVQKVAAA